MKKIYKLSSLQKPRQSNGKIAISCLLLLLLTISSIKSSAQLVSWLWAVPPGVQGSPIPVSSQDPNVTVSSGASGLTAGTGAARWNWTHWNTAGSYLQFTAAAASGYVLNVTSFSFDVGTSGTGPTSFNLYSSADNYTTAISTTITTTTSGQTSLQTFTLPPASQSGVSYNGLSTITFRLSGNGAAAAGTGTGGPVHVNINGTSSVAGCSSVVPGTISSSAGNSGCGTFSSTLSLLGASTGSDITYQWKSSTDGITYTNAAGTSNAATYSVNSISATTYYKAFVTCTSASKVDSTPVFTATIASSVVPTVSISGTTTLCSGTSITFTAASVNGGTAPTYQWKKNGSNVGTNTTVNTYTDAGLVNGDQITCVMASNSPCASTSTATSNTLTEAVTTSVTPTIVISSSVSANIICAGTNVNFLASVTNAGSGTGSSYQWKKNGNNVGTNAGTYNDTVLNNGDVITCVLTSNANCASPATVTSAGITMTVHSLPAVTVSAPVSVCAGATVNFTAAGATSYSWAPGGATTTSISLNPTATTTYTVTGTDANNCFAKAVTKVTINSSVSSFTITPATAAICDGGSAKLTANLVGTVTPLSEDFNGTAPGWSVINASVPSTANSIVQWKQESSPHNTGAGGGNRSFTSLDGTSFYMSNADSGSHDSTNTILVSPSFSLANMSSATLSYQGYYDRSATADVYVGIDISIDGGSTWTNVSMPTTDYVTGGAFALTQKGPIDLSAYVGNANAMLRFKYVNYWGYYWAIDNVVVTGNALPAWSPVAGLYTNSALTAPYTTGAFADSVFAAPTAGTTATYTGSVGTCATTATAAVTTNPLPAASFSSAGSTICAGSPVTVSFTGTPNATITYTVNGSITRTITLNNSGTASYAPIFTLNAMDSTYAITNVMAVTSCGKAITGQQVVIHVNPQLIPTINVGATATTICAGTNVTFTANVANPGATPVYHWTKNGTAVGTNNPIYSDNTLNNGDSIACTLNSSAVCATPAIVSAHVIMTVNPIVTPTISITSSSPSNIICTGTSVTFTAHATGTGSAPVYVWTKNGATVGTNTTTYTDANLANGDKIVCTLTSNVPCATAGTVSSTAITMTVNQYVTPAVTVVVNPGATICQGTNVIFTATGVNGGPTPTYNWQKNGSGVGTNSNIYTDNTLNNGDVVKLIYTSSVMCVTTAQASQQTTMVVNTLQTPAVSIAASTTTTICSGTSVTFTATATNPGTAPVYQWKKNGVNVGTNNATYTSTTLADNDLITCTLTSSVTCLTTNNVTSNSIAMTVHSMPAFVLNPVNKAICVGDTVTFKVRTSSVLTATLQWQVSTDGGSTWTNISAATDTSYTVVTTSALNQNRYRVVSTNSCGATNSSAAVLTVNPLPAIVITKSANSASCTNDSVTLTAGVTNGTGAVYSWLYNGSYVTSGQLAATYVAHTAGNYSVTVEDFNTCIATSAPVAVGIKYYPSAPIYTMGGDLTHCANDSAILGTNITNLGYTYQWQRNQVNIAGATSASYSAILSGAYKVEVNNLGCVTNSDTLVVTANPIPAVTVSYPKTTLCGTDSIKIRTASNSGITYQWYEHGYAIANATDTTYLATTAGIYSLMETNTYGCSAMSASQVVFAEAVPLPSINYQNNLLVTGSYVTYQWGLDGVTLSGANYETFSPVHVGDYTVTVKDALGCVGTSYPYDFMGLAVSNVIAKDITVYPNPTTAIVHIQSPVKVNVIVYSLDGKMLLQQANATELNIGSLANGMYMLQVNDENNSLIKNLRIVKAGE